MPAQTNQTQKISIKIWRPALDKFNDLIESSCLRRDAYLNRVLTDEVVRLDQEVSIPNSAEAQKFVSKKLDLLDRKLFSLTLPPKLIESIDDVCKRKRIVRDAFFNRFFLLLVAKRALVSKLFFPDDDAEWNWQARVWSERKHDGPFVQNVFQPLNPDIDPLWPIRAAIEMENDEQGEKSHDYVVPQTGDAVKVQTDVLTQDIVPLTNLYTKLFNLKIDNETDLIGLNCYLPDREIPDSQAASTYKKKLDELLGF